MKVPSQLAIPKSSTLAIQPELKGCFLENRRAFLSGSTFKKHNDSAETTTNCDISRKIQKPLSLWPVQAMVLFLNFSLKATVTLFLSNRSPVIQKKSETQKSRGRSIGEKNNKKPSDMDGVP